MIKSLEQPTFPESSNDELAYKFAEQEAKIFAEKEAKEEGAYDNAFWKSYWENYWGSFWKFYWQEKNKLESGSRD